MRDTHTGDKLPKIGIPFLDSSPRTFAAKRRTNLTGLTQQRETDSVQPLGLLPVTMTLRKILRVQSGPGLRGPLGSSQRSSVQKAPAQTPVSGLLPPVTLGSPYQAWVLASWQG